MANIAGDTSVYNAQTDWENERKYLSGLAKGGNTWAVDQLSALSEAEKMYTQPKKPTAPSVNISTPVQDRSALIEQLYKAQQDAAIAELDAAYNQNVIDLDAAKNKIPGVYAAQRNRTASDAAVNQRNFGEFAAASGLGSGANAQARLAMNNQLTSGLSSIAQAEADALAEIETERARVQAKYKADVAAAIAEGNAAKAQALYAEAVRIDEMLQQQAVQNAQLALQQAELERALYNDEYERSLLEAKKTSGTGGGWQPTGYMVQGDDGSWYVNDPSPALKVAQTYQKNNGTMYEPIATQVANMKQSGYTDDQILDYLDLFDETKLTDSAFTGLITQYGLQRSANHKEGENEWLDLKNSYGI